MNPIKGEQEKGSFNSIQFWKKEILVCGFEWKHSYGESSDRRRNPTNFSRGSPQPIRSHLSGLSLNLHIHTCIRAPILDIELFFFFSSGGFGDRKT
jgi:hypothetical protein